MQGPWFNSHVRKILWRRDKLPTPVFLGFPCGSAGKESTCNAEDLVSILRLGRSPGEEKGYPLQYSDLESSKDYTVHGVAKSWTQLSDFHFTSLLSFNIRLYFISSFNKVLMLVPIGDIIVFTHHYLYLQLNISKHFVSC